MTGVAGSEVIPLPILDVTSTLLDVKSLEESNGVYSTSFTWGSETGIGSKDSQKSGLYDYYTDGVFLRFTVKQGETQMKFNEVFKTYEDGNNGNGGMTLQTDLGAVNDMDGSFRELADWGDTTKSGYATTLPGENSVFYGVIQHKDYGTKTVGFDAGQRRVINMTLEPKADLVAGTYTIEVEVVQQTSEKILDTTSYEIVILN